MCLLACSLSFSLSLSLSLSRISFSESIAGQKASPTFSTHLYQLPVYSSSSVYPAFFHHPWVAILLLYSPSIICSSHDVSYTHVYFFILLVEKMSSTLVCSLIHDGLFLFMLCQALFSATPFEHFEVFISGLS